MVFHALNLFCLCRRFISELFDLNSERKALGVPSCDYHALEMDEKDEVCPVTKTKAKRKRKGKIINFKSVLVNLFHCLVMFSHIFPVFIRLPCSQIQKEKRSI